MCRIVLLGWELGIMIPRVLEREVLKDVKWLEVVSKQRGSSITYIGQIGRRSAVVPFGQAQPHGPHPRRGDIQHTATITAAIPPMRNLAHTSRYHRTSSPNQQQDLEPG